MLRFVSSKNPVKLKKEYLAKYNVNLLQKSLDQLLTKYPNIKTALPKDITAKKLLVGNFKYLAKVYNAYTGYLNGKTSDDRLAICNDFVAQGFKYSSHRAKIAEFLIDTNNGFDIHNCVYCDIEDVGIFTKADRSNVRKFETEHVLDKGACPLVALSLYNFVPSCGTCNGASIKGTKTIGDTEVEIAKLSPSAEGYDFDGKVKFEVKIVTPSATDLNAITHINDYEIDFNIIEIIYRKSIDLFELKQRYNNGKQKIELINWRDKRRRYPNNKVQELADQMMVTFDVMFEDLFELNLRKENHYPMEKARREVMML